MLVAAGGWLLYTQVWTGKSKPVAWTDLTPQLGAIEFTRKVTAVYHSRGPFVRLLRRRTTGPATRSW